MAWNELILTRQRLHSLTSNRPMHASAVSLTDHRGVLFWVGFANEQLDLPSRAYLYMLLRNADSGDARCQLFLQANSQFIPVLITLESAFTMSEIFDVLVIGGGPIGLAATYEVAKSGSSTIVLEQNNFYNQAGSSGDLARMFRTMYVVWPRI